MTYQIPTNRDLWIDQQVATILGFSDFTIGTGGFLWGYRPAEPDDHPYSIQDGRKHCPIPHYSTHLPAAWMLHFKRPAGTILFSLRWVDEEPEKVARHICKAFIKWHYARRAASRDDARGGAS